MERAKKLIDTTAYQYDYSSRTWVAAPTRYANLPAKDTPVILFGEFGIGEWGYQCFHAKKHQRMMWCEEHGNFEKIHHIERIDSIRTVCGGRKIGASCACAHTRPSPAVGCRKHGMVAHFSFHAPPIVTSENKLTVPYRWRVARYDDGSVEVNAEAIRFRLVYRGENEYQDTQAEKYTVHPRRIALREVFDIRNGISTFCNKRRDWADYGIDIPSEIVAEVFEHLREYAGKDYNPLPDGIMVGANKAHLPKGTSIASLPPTLALARPCASVGVEKLRAFVKRPQDFHIEYWRGFFDDDTEFEKLFPKGQTDNLPVLCRELNLTLTDNLRAAYEKNPYAPLWEKLLRFWGFQDEEAIAVFYELKDFAGMRPEHFHFDKTKDELILNGLKGWQKIDNSGYEFLIDTSVVTAYEAHIRFDMLRFYVIWALSTHTERTFAKRGLYALAARPWSKDLHEELDTFYWRFRSYCHYAWTDEGDNPWAEIAADIERLSVMSRHHLLGLNTEWFGWHWQVEHDRLMEEFHNLGTPGKNVEERKPKSKLSRLSRILKIYDAILANVPPLIPIRRDEYPHSMWRRDLKVLRSFDPSFWVDEEGKAHRTPRYSLHGEFPPLPNGERRTRLLAYRLFLEDCGYMTAELAEKITGKKISRRTFVRDLEFLRETCACGRLTYHAAEKIYAWESLGNETRSEM